MRKKLKQGLQNLVQKFKVWNPLRQRFEIKEKIVIEKRSKKH
jgi:hypothetical protein